MAVRVQNLLFSALARQRFGRKPCARRARHLRSLCFPRNHERICFVTASKARPNTTGKILRSPMESTHSAWQPPLLALLCPSKGRKKESQKQLSEGYSSAVVGKDLVIWRSHGRITRVESLELSARVREGKGSCRSRLPISLDYRILRRFAGAWRSELLGCNGDVGESTHIYARRA